MKRSICLSIMLLSIVSGNLFGATRVDPIKPSHKQYYFRANAVYTISYRVNERETKTLEEVSFIDIWLSPPSELEYSYLDPASTFPQEHYKSYYLIEFWKEYADGKQESYLIPVRDIVEVQFIVKKRTSR